MSIRPGVRLGDRYQLLSPIATGGMGQVWRAEDTTLHRVVAAKILRSEFTGDETFLARFRAEARNTASLSNPNIASVYDYGEQVHESERLCYLVMELVEGEPLVDILLRERRLSSSRMLDYLEQTALGLAAAHREGMVHRDIKPGNLIIRHDGVLKITDFGIARAANAVALTEQGTVVGTAQYLAPEQAEGKPARPASDIYALGVVGYECLAGFRPFDGDNSVAIALAQIRDTPRPLPPDVPPAVRSLIAYAMNKNPDARYVDGDMFVAAIKQVRNGNPPPPPPVRSTPPSPPRQLPGGPAPARPAGSMGGPSATFTAPRPGPPAGPVGMRDASVPIRRQVAGPAAPAGEPPQTPAGSRRRWVLIAVAALAAIALVIALFFLLRDTGDSGSQDSSATTSSTQPSADEQARETTEAERSAGKIGPEPIVLDPENLAAGQPFTLNLNRIIGQPVTDVTMALLDLDADLSVYQVYNAATGEPGTVAAIDPEDGIVAPGEAVVLYVVPEAGSPT